jgi:hypothetical protein
MSHIWLEVVLKKQILPSFGDQQKTHCLNMAKCDILTRLFTSPSPQKALLQFPLDFVFGRHSAKNRQKKRKNLLLK